MKCSLTHSNPLFFLTLASPFNIFNFPHPSFFFFFRFIVYLCVYWRYYSTDFRKELLGLKVMTSLPEMRPTQQHKMEARLCRACMEGRKHDSRALSLRFLCFSWATGIFHICVSQHLLGGLHAKAYERMFYNLVYGTYYCTEQKESRGNEYCIMQQSHKCASFEHTKVGYCQIKDCCRVILFCLSEQATCYHEFLPSNFPLHFSHISLSFFQ